MLGVLKPTTGGEDITLSASEVVIGRNRESDIRLKFSDVSGRHCHLVLDKGYWYVVDFRSTNGTRVNGVKVTDIRVDPGARIRFSTHEYLLEYDPDANGSDGTTPPDHYDNDIFSRSLLEVAGLSTSRPKQQEDSRSTFDRTLLPSDFSTKDPDGGIQRRDYTDLTLDDILFDN